MTSEQLADRMVADEIEAFAHLSTEDIRGEVERLDAIDTGLEYILSTPSWKVHEDSTKLYRFRRELKRRIDAETFADLASAQAIHAETAAMWMEAAE
jgi:hypothetical protein